MAHLQKSQDRFNVRVCHPRGHRSAIRLGRCTAQNAKAVKGHIERMVESIELAMPLPPATTFWLSRIGDRMHERLVRIQLCEPRGGRPVGITMAGMVDAYIARRVDLKPQSLKAIRTTRNKLVAFFGACRVVNTITVAEAHDFRRAVATEVAPATTAKVTMIARQYFADAVNRELITKNPFVGIKPGSQRNPARQRFIPREVIDRVIAGIPSIHWRMVVAFARYGGLRIPSELLHLEWSDIDWARKCILIRSPKTEHHVGHATRQIPLFPELAGLLEEGRRSATAVGSALVFPRAMLKSGNLRTEFRRKLKTLGIEPWPKTFQNLRATRQTELTELFPAHVVCKWLGNSEKVAMQHYLQTTDAHFERAAQPLPVVVTGPTSEVVSTTDRGTNPSIAMATPIGSVVCGLR